ncbi:O-antigen ligase family protein [Chroococcus sp. FPU101]|uniref:O-antigen ligase family protein n=1 Tax=Chroococcus sp. FPU101 TaxID=1974212 RepID=UPI001A902009|nr:O-antigen ligase family protein [Chroococcus sp. FPU101]GFE67715.1 O-antigen polymerase [Chroococcus sp. FPU101]
MPSYSASDTNTFSIEISNAGKLWLMLTTGFYIMFTLVPDSHSLMVQWPWVAFWQIGLLCPIIWLLSLIWHHRRLKLLGGLDWVVGIATIGLIFSILGTEFKPQAFWNVWAVLGGFGALYALFQWIGNSQQRYQLLVKQGYLNLAFIVISFFLWLTQTVFPEISRLNALQASGVNIPFDFTVLELRNWAPLGHQNYVAGYLLLALPLLVALAILQPNRRSLWCIGVVLGIINLYTTSSKGGWLGLLGLLGSGLMILIFKSRLPRRWLGIAGVSSLTVLLMFIFSNNRLRQTFANLTSGEGSNELAYRWINTNVGWMMGSSHPFTGIGVGNVPLAYQKYRPIWAGQESELIYQLHSTPVQLFAEMGVWGILTMIGAIVWLIHNLIRYRSTNTTDDILLWSLVSGLFAYVLMSLTDYQLDNIPVSGTLIIYFAVIASLFSSKKQFSHPMPVFYTGLGLTIAVIIWLIPIHRAWQLSNQGFFALNQDRVDAFRASLAQAQKIAPWEPYYPYQLGWNIGNLAYTTQNPQERQKLLSESVTWFEKGNTASPYQEFGKSNLGWLLLSSSPTEATKAFTQSIQLIPAKQGNFYGLGLSLLRQNKIELGIDAIAFEAIRHPLFITSPIWRSKGMQPLYRPVVERMYSIYDKLLQNPSSDLLKSNLLQSCGALSWWIGDYAKARQDWDKNGTSLSQELLALSEGKPALSNHLIVQAFNQPNSRMTLLRQAWIIENKEDLPTSLEPQLLASMASSKNFIQWLKENPPILQYRNQRAGFGVNSRHIDGIQPYDYYPIVENLALATWFSEVFPNPKYFPELDLALQPLHQELLKKL